MNTIDDFLDSKPFADATRSRYRRTLTKFLVDHDDGGEGLTVAQFRKWLKNDGAWGLKTQHGEMNGVKGFLRYHFGEQHPALRLKLPTAPASGRKALSLDDVRVLMASFDKSPIGVRDRAIASLFLDTAYRVSEMARITTDDLDMSDLSVSVLVKGGKRSRRVFSPRTYVSVLDWLIVREQLNTSSDSCALWLSLGSFRGSPLTADGIKMAVRRWEGKTGLRLYAHRFRHTFATQTTINGAPKNIAKAGGGWKSDQVFDNYTQGLVQDHVRPYLITSMLEDS